MKTYIIYQDNKEIKRFENQNSDFPTLKYIQSHQGQSLNWALKNGGWKVEEIDEETKKSIFWN
tara:strand:+ start:406 stop:594 length:189 start_codon:yes stop_codon:yes gene_type:complete